MHTNRIAWHAAALLLAAVWGGAPPPVMAQAGEKDVGELAALGGGTFGIGAHPTATGSAGIAFSRYAMALFETTYMPMGNHTIQSWPDRSTIDRSYTIDFGFNVHIRIPVHHRWEPYAIAGTGVLWNLIRQDTVNLRGNAVVKHYDQFNGALHTGGGLRFYVGQNWGIRPECKVIV